MTKTAMLVALFALTSCNNGTEQDVEVFSARLDTAEVVPPRSGEVRGNAGFTFDGANIWFKVDLANLDLARRNDRFLRIRIHSGTRGTNGAPLVSSTLPEYSMSTSGPRLLWEGRFGPAGLDSTHTVEEVVAEMRSGHAYAVVTHWQILANGETGVAAARGQIDPLRVR